MAREFGREERLAEQIQRSLSTALLLETKDPRITGLTVSDVKVTRDLATATIYISMPSNSDTELVLVGLERAKGFLRSRIAKQMRSRWVPDLRFIHDDTLDVVERIEALLSASAPRSKPQRNLVN